MHVKISRSYILLASMAPYNFDYDHTVTSTTLAVGESSKDATMELTKSDESFGLGRAVDTKLTKASYIFSSGVCVHCIRCGRWS